MLQLILGTAGTGKTEMLYQRIEEVVQKKHVLLIVPEQASFESEKQLYRKLGAQKALDVDVLSFTRLCDRVFRAYGSMAGIHMEDDAKILLMSVALDALRESLQLYNKNAAAPFIASMCEVIHEMKSAGVVPEALREAAEEQFTIESKNKLLDIALIYEAYQATIMQGYDDPDDHLVRAGRLLEGKDFFKDTCIFVDGFTAFMGAEWGLLREMLCGGAELTIALCCDELGAGSVFAAASATARRLIELAGRCGTKVSPLIKLTEYHRFKAVGLVALASDFPIIRPDIANSEGVILTECDDLYDEIETVAARISKLIRDGYRYRDIVVITRDTSPYQAALESVFARYDIPYFDDRKVDAAVFPLARGLLCALDAVQSGFESEFVLSLAKSGLLALTSEHIGVLENYCYVWNITKKVWRIPFTNHPDGLKTNLNDEAASRLVIANEARETLMEGLLLLENELQNCDGCQFAIAIYHYLQQIQASENLQLVAENMSPSVGKEFLEQNALLWDTLMGILDIFGGALGKIRYPTGRFIELFRLCIDTLQIGVLPQTLDQVLVGGADRIRPNEPKIAFIIGLNEGRFPAWHGSGGLLSDTERECLKESGVDLMHTAEQQAILESYYVYYALTRASEKIVISWPTRDTAGHSLSKSTAVHQLQRLFPDCTEYSGSLLPLERIGGEKSAFDLMARGWRESTSEQVALRSVLYERSPKQYEILESISELHPYALKGDGKELFDGDLRLSPSRLEKYFLCPFSFFCESGLGLKMRRRAEFNPLESGTLIHLVLQEMVKRYGVELDNLDDVKLREESAALLTNALEERVNAKDMPRRSQYLFARQVDTLTLLLRHLGEEFAQSNFIPTETELQIREKASCKPLRLWSTDGSRILIEGVVDRLDIFEENGKKYLRVVDYKTGIKKFDLEDICHGLNMQMLIYLFALCDSYGNDIENNVPAGVLYMPARADVLDAKRETEPERFETMRDAQLKMNGILLDNLEALEAMEPTLKGRFIPVKASDGELDRKKSSVISNKQFAAIRKAVESRLAGMADRLKAGCIEAFPILHPENNDGRTICDNCDFAMICLHEADDVFRELTKLDHDAVLQELGAQEEKNNG